MATPHSQVLDVLGTYCPVPVIETRRVIRGLSEPLELKLLTDDPETLHDIPALLERTGGKVLSVEDLEPGGWCLTLRLEPQKSA